MNNAKLEVQRSKAALQSLYRQQRFQHQMASSLLAQSQNQSTGPNPSQQMIQRLNEISEIYNPEPA